MSKVEWGVKRTCASCQGRFYDLLKSPITCPDCGSIFELQAFGKTRRGKADIKHSHDEILEHGLLDDQDLEATLIDDDEDDLDESQIADVVIDDEHEDED